MTIAYVIARRRGYPVRPRSLSAGDLLVRLWQVIPALLMPIIIVGGILGGIFTATEAAAVAVAYAVLVGFLVTKELRWRDIPPALLKAGITTSVVFMLIATSNVVSWLLTTQQVPRLVAQFLRDVAPSPWIFLLLVNIFLLIVGCLLDLSAAIIMFVPILAPVALIYGVDPLHFGFVVVLNLVIGLLTPPVGVCLFVVCRNCQNLVGASGSSGLAVLALAACGTRTGDLRAWSLHSDSAILRIPVRYGAQPVTVNERR